LSNKNPTFYEAQVHLRTFYYKGFIVQIFAHDIWIEKLCNLYVRKYQENNLYISAMTVMLSAFETVTFHSQQTDIKRNEVCKIINKSFQNSSVLMT